MLLTLSTTRPTITTIKLEIPLELVQRSIKALLVHPLPWTVPTRKTMTKNTLEANKSTTMNLLIRTPTRVKKLLIIQFKEMTLIERIELIKQNIITN